MSNSDDVLRKSQDFFQIFTKARDFTEELLKENERLRFKIAGLESAGGALGADDRVRERMARFLTTWAVAASLLL